MESEDLYPSDGTYFAPIQPEPQEQTAARKKEQAETLVIKDELQRIVKHFEERIKATDSIQNAMNVASEYELSKEVAIAVMDMVCKQLEDEKRLIQELLEIHIKK